MLDFSQVLKPIKRQDLFEEGKKATMPFKELQGFILAKKKYFGARGTLIELFEGQISF